MTNKRKVMVVVDSRATWTRAKTVCEEVMARDDLELQLVRVGPAALAIHSKEFDLPSQPHLSIFLTHKDGQAPMTEIVGVYVEMLGEHIQRNQPDIVVSVTDRYESLAVAVAASLSNIHLAHIQGGEVSGAIDESIRHAITKLSHIHFPANLDSAQRIEGLGEDSRYIFNVGCPATDLLLRVDIRDMRGLDPYIMVAYNPVTTLTPEQNYREIKAVLDVCQNLGMRVDVIGPNHDPMADSVWQAIKESGFRYRATVDHNVFVRGMAHASVMIGNSSAGIREACYFGTPVVNVGIRQLLRAVSKNVLTVHDPTKDKIRRAIEAQLEHGRYEVEKPYGTGGAGKKIAEILATIDLPPIQKHIRY